MTPILRNSNANMSTGYPLRIPYFWNYKTVKHKEFYLIFAYLTHQRGKIIYGQLAMIFSIKNSDIILAGSACAFLRCQSQKYWLKVDHFKILSVIGCLHMTGVLIGWQRGNFNPAFSSPLSLCLLVRISQRRQIFLSAGFLKKILKLKTCHNYVLRVTEQF